MENVNCNMSLYGEDINFLDEADYTDEMKKKVYPVLDANRKIGYFQSFDDAEIYYEYFLHPQEKAAVVISHGFCEFGAKYEEMIFYFFQEGYSVYFFEYRGHGNSQRFIKDNNKIYINSYDEYVFDLKNYIIKVVRRQSGQKKMVLFAHSMGGAVGTLFLERFPEFFSCAVLSSPMLELNCGIIPCFLVSAILWTGNTLGMRRKYVPGHGKFDGVSYFETGCCQSKARYDDILGKRMQNQNYQTNGATVAWVLASMKAIKVLQKNADKVKTPVLLFQAGCDTLVKPGGQNRFAQRSQNTQMVIMPGAKHEIYYADRKTRESYYQKIFEFIGKNI
jgi:lysophospholipase